MRKPQFGMPPSPMRPLPAKCSGSQYRRLCAADHGNHPVVLGRWLSNKTPEIVAFWIARLDNSVLVAVKGEAILAVGSVTDAGEIGLNYVAPSARFRGISRALLGALEARAAARGNARCTLISTETARRFYRAAGYADDGPPDGKFGTRGGYPTSKYWAAQKS